MSLLIWWRVSAIMIESPIKQFELTLASEVIHALFSGVLEGVALTLGDLCGQRVAVELREVGAPLLDQVLLKGSPALFENTMDDLAWFMMDRKLLDKPPQVEKFIDDRFLSGVGISLCIYAYCNH